MKILVILSRIPYPLEKGDKLRAFHQLRELSKKHEICLCCLHDEQPHPDAREQLAHISNEIHFIPLKRPLIYLQLFLAWLSNKPFQVAYFYQRKAHRHVQRIIKSFGPDHIYCQLVRTTEYAKHEYNIPKTLDYQDAFSKGMARRAEKEKYFWMRRFFRMEARRLILYEHLIFEFFENKCIISDQDKSLIMHEKQKEIAVIPNGVDLDFFHPQEQEKTFDLCFTGNMGYAPNIDSVLFLVNEVLPLIEDRKPGITLLISGATPAEAIQRLSSKRVNVAGWVDDIRDSYAASRIFIAPMQIGTGLQNKLLEAMAMGIPCITSPLANNALGARHEEHLIVAREPKDYADAVIRLLEDQKAAGEMARRARAFVAERYSWANSVKQLEQLMQGGR